MDDRIEPPWDDLDPGIAALVRYLWDSGYDTRDSGDGRSKAAKGWDPETYSEVPHVGITVARDAVGRTLGGLLDLVSEEGWSEVEVSAHAIIWPDGRREFIVMLAGDELYGWTPSEAPRG